MLPPLFDMHCHLDFATNMAEAATAARELNIRALAATVTPTGFAAAQQSLESARNIRVGLGLHPWQVADGTCGEREIAQFETLAAGVKTELETKAIGNANAGAKEPANASTPASADANERAGANAIASTPALAATANPELPRADAVVPRWIGEVGLDFAGERGSEQARATQLAAFERVLASCDACSSAYPGTRPRMLSLHAVRAATDVLDALERFGTHLRHRCVFHWFSGTSDELTRAIRLGCYFSAGSRMLASKRGRAYVRAIPRERLLLETDLPPHDGCAWSAEAWRGELERTLHLLAETRGQDERKLAHVIAATSAQLLEDA